MFDQSQNDFIQLKKILAEGTAPVYLWIGAGVSIEAGYPSWIQLRDDVIDKGLSWLDNQGELSDRESRKAKLNVAKNEKDLWRAFDYIFEAIGSAQYREFIYAAFNFRNPKIPDVYKKLLNIKKLKGVVTTNIDGLVGKVYAQSHNVQGAIEFSGKNCAEYAYTLAESQFVILNLHGKAENYPSWVMRKADLRVLQGDANYKNYIRALFMQGIVVFVGVNPMDVAVRAHLEKVRPEGVSESGVPMYWLTADTSDAAFEFANKYNIRRIFYSAADNHRELKNVVELLNEGRSHDDENPVPAFENAPVINCSLRNFSRLDFGSMRDVEVREYLNKKANDILRKKDSARYQVYDNFLREHQREIHRAWFVASGEKLLGLTLENEIGEGAFGRVFRAVDEKGQSFAVKVLKEDVMRKPAYLQSFRRGVQAMRILRDKSIKGIVKFNSATEIPASVVMELVEGENLYDIVMQRQMPTWKEKMWVLTEVAQIIKTAHALPERVLHRDIRPHNIMIRDFYSGGKREVCVLDFDLAFHKDANEVSVPMGMGNGYTAPEQTDRSGRYGQTRSSRVDSYGFAMLCYFVITGKEPVSRQCMMKDWDVNVFEDIAKHQCAEWRSLPYKIARMVKECTKCDQNKRWDLYQMYAYMQSLYKALVSPSAVKAPEFVLDEVAYRVAIAQKCQEKIDITVDGHRTFQCASGTYYTFYMDGGDIAIEIGWHNNGNFDFSRVMKSISDRANALVAKLQKACFVNAHSHSERGGVIVEVAYDISDFKMRDVERLVDVLKYDISPRGVY